MHSSSLHTVKSQIQNPILVGRVPDLGSRRVRLLLLREPYCFVVPSLVDPDTNVDRVGGDSGILMMECLFKETRNSVTKYPGPKYPTLDSRVDPYTNVQE